MAAELETEQYIYHGRIGFGKRVSAITDLPTPGRVCVPVELKFPGASSHKKLWLEVLGHEAKAHKDDHEDHCPLSAIWCIAYRLEIPAVLSEGQDLVEELCDYANDEILKAPFVEVWNDHGCHRCGKSAKGRMQIGTWGVLKGPGPKFEPEGVLVKLSGVGERSWSTCTSKCEA